MCPNSFIDAFSTECFIWSVPLLEVPLYYSRKVNVGPQGMSFIDVYSVLYLECQRFYSIPLCNMCRDQ